MASVFAQVAYNPRSSGKFCEYGSVHWVGLDTAPSLTKGRYMIDVDG
jgi:hypothetical protein